MLHRVDDGVDARRQYGAESREIDMEEDDSADYQQAADHQQAEAPNFPQVKIKEDEETPYPLQIEYSPFPHDPWYIVIDYYHYYY